MPAPSRDSMRPGLLRRLGAVIYDAFLLFAVLFFATALALPLTGGEAIRPGQPLFTSYLFMVSFFFYAWSWVRGGQTLGMRAWRLRVQRPDGSPMTWWQALLRFLVAIASWLCLGLGFLWILVDSQRRTWHDIASETVVVMVEPTRRR